jgi:uncharacterized protein (DUF362 family)
MADVATPSTAAQELDLTPRAYLPVALSNYPPPKVVHVHDAEATHWDFSSGWYGDHVDQDTVNAMVERGLMELAETASVSEAWASMLPDYLPGKKIAIKVNLNNASCSDADKVIDALIYPVNALIRTLVAAGVQEEDVWVYDAVRPMPSRFYGRRQYALARYFDEAGCADEKATFNHIDRSLRVTFSNPALTRRWLTDLLFQATYLINMPILKKHGTHPVTLGFKNHFGSLDNLGGSGDDNPHPYITPSDSRYSPTFSPLVDINANPNIAGKTVLTLADGLFGAPSVGAKPIPWQTFSNSAPNSLLFSRDRVAIDCVMCDLLRAEWGLDEAAYDYLRLAHERGLGQFERGDPWGSGYTQLNYVRVDL